MRPTVFWSWQSDAPKRETRDVIQYALEAAVDELAAEVQEADRAEVDQGAKDVVGMELIAEEILKKIDQAQVFVGDITTVGVIGEGRDRKHLPNPNVMLELGYARRALGPGRVIPVFNRAIFDSRHEDLPFDLRHMSGSIAFDLPVGAAKSDLAKARTVLQRQFVSRLRAMMQAHPNTLREEPAAEWRSTMPSDPSIWEEGYHPLAVTCPHSGRVEVIVAPAPRIYARVRPAAQGTAPAAPGGLFPDSANCLSVLGGGGGGMSAGRTGNGHAMFESIGVDRTTKSIVRWYKDTGEIWALSSWNFYQRGAHPHLACEEMVKDLVSWLTRAMRTSHAANGEGPFRVRLGVVGLQRVIWWQSRPSPDSNAILGLNDFASYEASLRGDSHEAVIDLVISFVEQVADAFGVICFTRQQIAQWAGVK